MGKGNDKCVFVCVRENQNFKKNGGIGIDVFEDGKGIFSFCVCICCLFWKNNW